MTSDSSNRRPDSSPVRVAAVQASPVFLDRDATVEKACARIAEAGAADARLIVFPESFVPGYPDWVWVVPAGRGKELGELHAELLENSLTVPGPQVDRLCAAARAARSVVAIGITERNAEASGTSLYNTLLWIGADGALLGLHRKLVPTGGERLVWAPGDGGDLDAYETPAGCAGGLICWESYMPLARYALYAQGIRIYLAPTWDSSDAWLATLRHIAREGRVTVVGCGMVLRRDEIPERFAFRAGYAAGKEWINPGGTAIVDPHGKVVAGPCERREEILYAEVDARAGAGARWDLDVAGHYARPDVFRLLVRHGRRPLVEAGTGDELDPTPSAAPAEA